MRMKEESYQSPLGSVQCAWILMKVFFVLQRTGISSSELIKIWFPVFLMAEGSYVLTVETTVDSMKVRLGSAIFVLLKGERSRIDFKEKR